VESEIVASWGAAMLRPYMISARGAGETPALPGELTRSFAALW